MIDHKRPSSEGLFLCAGAKYEDTVNTAQIWLTSVNLCDRIRVTDVNQTEERRNNMNNISLSDGEWKIMKQFWESSPRTIGQLVSALERETGWTKTTVFVMLKRLIAKGAVAMEEGERCHEYYPLIERGEVAREETKSFISRVYDGSIGMLVSSLAGQKALSEGDIQELRKILDEAEGNRRPKGE